jgi:multidrug efflux pump subunit AcrA (membrane-fusion protein)
MSPLVKTALRFLSGAAILIVGVLVMNGLIGMKESPKVSLPETIARPVLTQVVKNADIIPRIPVEGRVEAWHRIDLFVEVNGVLQLGGVEFREGTTYRKGDVILSLDDTESRANLKGARSKFVQLVTGMLASIKIDFPERSGVWDKYVASIDVANALPELPKSATDREGYFIVNRGVEASFHTIKASEDRASKFIIRAPFDGFVAKAMVRPGSLVRAGQPVGLFVGTGVYEIKTAVHERYLKSFKIGADVVFEDENGLRVAKGKVDRVSGNVNATTQSATVFCKVNESMDGEMRDGRYLSGFISASEIKNVVEIPLNLFDSEGDIFEVRSGKLQKINTNQEFLSIKTLIVSGIPDGTVILREPVVGAYGGMEVTGTESGQ